MQTSEILDIKFHCGDLDGIVTIKEYFKEILLTFWREGECFSGKRPLGNSGWEYDLAIPLIKNKLLKGSLDEYGQVEELDNKAFDKIIEDCIKSL